MRFTVKHNLEAAHSGYPVITDHPRVCMGHVVETRCCVSSVMA